MKKKIYLILFLILISVLFCSCAKDKTDNDTIDVTVTIDASAVGGGMLLDNVNVSVSSDASVFDATFAACKQNDIVLSSRGLTSLRYIEGIGDYYEFDYGPASGWVYYVNDVSATLSSGAVFLNQDDNILWVYITE